MWFVQWLTELNLFESNATDDLSIRIERWSTRLYIVVLSFTMFIVSIYVLLEVITQHIEIQQPTLDLSEQLQEKYSAKCPCSNVSIPYRQFVQLVPIYHQVCSSDFVTWRWIDYLYNPRTTPFYYPEDFRATASQQFQLLATLCRLSAQAINDSLRSFGNTKLITGQLLSKTLFSAQMQAHIGAFKVNTPNQFNHTLMFVHQLLRSNTLLSAVRPYHTFQIRQSQDGSWINYMHLRGLYNLENYNCHCLADPNCQAPAGFLGDTLYVIGGHNNREQRYAHLDVVDGWYIGCLPIDSLLFSTLKSFYNQTALNSFSFFFANSSGNFTCLDANQPTIFHPSNTTLGTIVNASFIEDWIENITYASYFDICAPKSCAYTTADRFNVLYIITTLLGVYGGLSVALRFVIPIIINLLIRRKHNASKPESVSSRLRKLCRALLQLNLFKSAMDVEPRDISQQQWTTRFYILFLALTLSILLLYRKVNIQTIQINLTNLSLNEISHLQQQASSSSLQCPCSQLSASLKCFVEFKPTYHEVCSSDFVSEFWIRVFTVIHGEGSDFNAFERSGPAFRVLQSFCKLSKTTVNNALRQFDETQLVTKTLLTRELFMSQMDSSVTYFKSVTPYHFFDLLELMRETTRANQLITVFKTNFNLILRSDTDHIRANMIINDQFRDINNQSCSSILDRECKMQCFIDTVAWNFIPHPVAGFYASFYSVESLLLSQLQCLYDSWFIHSVGETFNPDYNRGFTALSKPSRFSVNATFAELANGLFIESWAPAFNYVAYFEQCQSRSCSYTVSQRPTLVSVMTMGVSLFGGLSALFRFVIPLIVTFVFARCHRQAQQEGPSQPAQGKGKKDSKNITVTDRPLD